MARHPLDAPVCGTALLGVALLATGVWLDVWWVIVGGVCQLLFAAWLLTEPGRTAA